MGGKPLAAGLRAVLVGGLEVGLALGCGLCGLVGPLGHRCQQGHAERRLLGQKPRARVVGHVGVQRRQVRAVVGKRAACGEALGAFVDELDARVGKHRHHLGSVAPLLGLGLQARVHALPFGLLAVAQLGHGLVVALELGDGGQAVERHVVGGVLHPAGGAARLGHGARVGAGGHGHLLVGNVERQHGLHAARLLLGGQPQLGVGLHHGLGGLHARQLGVVQVVVDLGEEMLGADGPHGAHAALAVDDPVDAALLVQDGLHDGLAGVEAVGLELRGQARDVLGALPGGEVARVHRLAVGALVGVHVADRDLL